MHRIRREVGNPAKSSYCTECDERHRIRPDWGFTCNRIRREVENAAKSSHYTEYGEEKRIRKRFHLAQNAARSRESGKEFT